jgi:hypothetical protein
LTRARHVNITAIVHGATLAEGQLRRLEQQRDIYVDVGLTGARDAEAILSRLERQRDVFVDVALTGISDAESRLKHLERQRTVYIDVALTGITDAEARLKNLERQRDVYVDIGISGITDALAQLKQAETQRKAEIVVKLIGLTKARADLDRLASSRNASITAIVNSSQILNALNNTNLLSSTLNFLSLKTFKINLNSRDLLTALNRARSLQLRLRLLQNQSARLFSQFPNSRGMRNSYFVPDLSGRRYAPPSSNNWRYNKSSGYLSTFEEGFDENFTNPGRLGMRVGTLLTYMVLGEISFGLQYAVIHAAQVTLEGQDLTTTQMLTRTPGNIAIINQVARDFLRGTEVRSMSQTEVRQIMTDLAGAIPADSPNFERIAFSITSALAEAKLIRPRFAEQDADALVGIIESAQISNDPARGEDLAQGFLNALRVAGPEFNSNAFLSALIQSGLATTIDGEGLFRLAAAFDDLRRPIGGDINRLIALSRGLNVPGVSKAQLEMLEEAGITEEDGGFRQRELLFENPGLWAESVIVPLLREQGVDLNDNIAVKAALEGLGFISRESRTLANIISGITEAANKYKEVLGVTATPKQATDRNLAAAFRNFAAQMNTLTTNVLTPLFEAMAPVLNKLADFTKQLAVAAEGLSAFDTVGIIVGAIYATFKALEGGARALGLLGPATALTGSASALTGSAGALTGAAAALTRAAAAQAVGEFADDSFGGRNRRQSWVNKALAALGLAGAGVGANRILNQAVPNVSQGGRLSRLVNFLKTFSGPLVVGTVSFSAYQEYFRRRVENPELSTEEAIGGVLADIFDNLYKNAQSLYSGLYGLFNPPVIDPSAKRYSLFTPMGDFPTSQQFSFSPSIQPKPSANSGMAWPSELDFSGNTRLSFFPQQEVVDALNRDLRTQEELIEDWREHWNRLSSELSTAAERIQAQIDAPRPSTQYPQFDPLTRYAMDAGDWVRDQLLKSGLGIGYFIQDLLNNNVQNTFASLLDRIRESAANELTKTRAVTTELGSVLIDDPYGLKRMRAFWQLLFSRPMDQVPPYSGLAIGMRDPAVVAQEQLNGLSRVANYFARELVTNTYEYLFGPIPVVGPVRYDPLSSAQYLGAPEKFIPDSEDQVFSRRIQRFDEIAAIGRVANYFARELVTNTYEYLIGPIPVVGQPRVPFPLEQTLSDTGFDVAKFFNTIWDNLKDQVQASIEYNQFGFGNTSFYGGMLNEPTDEFSILAERLAREQQALFPPELPQAVVQASLDLAASIIRFQTDMERIAANSALMMETFTPPSMDLPSLPDESWWQKWFGSTPGLDSLIGGSRATTQLENVFNSNVDMLRETFSTSATAMGTSIETAAEVFGPAVADELLAVAPEIGNAIGLAAAEQIQRANVNLRATVSSQQAPRMIDTGGPGRGRGNG